jgi:hypothetical protein
LADRCFAQAELLREEVLQKDSVRTRHVDPTTGFGLIDALLGVFKF